MSSTPERDAATDELWVEVTLRLPQDEFVHPDIVRDDLVDDLAFSVTSATVTDTSPGYMELAPRTAVIPSRYCECDVPGDCPDIETADCKLAYSAKRDAVEREDRDAAIGKATA